MVFITRGKTEMKQFVDRFEDNSVSMDVEMMSNLHFNEVPIDGPVRTATVITYIYIHH